MNRLFTALAALMSFGTLASATVSATAQLAPAPQILNFQGRLTKPDGTPVADGTYSVTFSLFPVVSGGTAVWTQTVATLPVRNGAFSTLLSGFPAGTFNTDLWLQIQIGANPALTPRQRLVSVAYAIKAGSVSDGAITSASLTPSLLNSEFWRLGGNGNTNPASNFLGTTDNQPLVFRTSNTERMRLDTFGRVFMGRPNAIGAGRLILSENTNSYTGMYVDAGANGLPFYGYTQNGTNAAWTYLDGSNGNNWKLFHGGGDRLTVTTSGLVGIGTNDPAHALDVAGNIRSRGADFILNGRGGGFGNSGGAGRALVDDGTGATTGGGLIINFSNDFGKVKVDSSLEVFGLLTLLAGGLRFPDGTLQTTAASAGASGWSLTGNAGTNPATQFLGTTDNQALVLRSNNNRLLGLQYVVSTLGSETYTSGNVIGGYWLNSITAGVTGATIAGGGNRFTIAAGSTDSVNRVTDVGGTVGGGSGNRAGNDDADLLNGRWAVVGGGVNNTAGARFATVGGGNQNTASGVDATVAGGWLNTASGLDSAVVGGQGNIASADRSVIVGGYQNRASGPYSLAAGNFANAQHFGAFVWGDFSSSSYLNSTADNQFSVRAAGGVRFFSNSALTAGVTLAPGGGSWSSVSDRNAKTNVRPVDPDDILNRLMGIPVSTWNYNSQDAAVRHIGPMAQDFFAAFHVGEDEKRITTIDADGVALASVQALARRLEAQKKQQEADRAELRAVKAENAELRAQLNALTEAVKQLQAERQK